MAVSDVNIIHPPLLLSTVKRLISQVCRFTWDTSLGDALPAPTMGHYRSDSSLHPWKRQTSRISDVALTRIRPAAGVAAVSARTSQMAVSDGNIIHTPLLLSIVKRLISQVCRFTWDTSLGDALRAPTMGHYRSDSSPHPWKRQTSRILDVALTRIRLGPHKLTQQLEGDDRREAENGDGFSLD
ncbi:hypothetical protein GWK47_019929 [Chionoecetes opilio]|uniref:Uncharacterized protein n=1 Tax=Chionoecetes opilio TaxID=41210 RepID=A0A8J4XQ04_CHIOP|nr:hypothetical protein GWK47_019929 [Chionoecetes opilio]